MDSAKNILLLSTTPLFSLDYGAHAALIDCTLNRIGSLDHRYQQLEADKKNKSNRGKKNKKKQNNTS